ncbi:FimV/HubP family polar landmark protein [Acinetobacter sp. WCHAc010052]|uniref:FimV/HubP family polar landmark protein n=1 Tax=Acinetobacter sp. WCHAc010052 TaxID=2004647 RepID=UPI000B3C9C0B|nr:FimV/HubP family polar landmark protein [Acinetobacter sp. WCHAc010052]AXY61215.1 hypothetical protein CDG61_15055 [Acinetobacter sp. WCHAc010052]
MLIYVIPLILLIVVLLVVKKKQAGNESGATQKKAASAKGKKSSSTKKVPQPTQVVEDTVLTAQKKTTPLSADVRDKIQGLIQERNFSGAEAQINQALNRDNTQHELYLFLFDIHLLQKDEFAISQLLNHIESLELNSILEQAQAKKDEYDRAHASTKDTIDFVPSSGSAVQTAPSAKATADFDALMQTPDTATSQTPAFDRLQQELSASSDSVLPELKALPSDFSSLSVESSVPVTPAAEVPAPAPVAEPVPEIKPLDFNLTFDPAPAAQPVVEAEKTEEIKPLDFSFTLDTPVTDTPAVEAEKPAEAEAVPEFKFDFSATETSQTETAAEPVSELKPEFSFSLDPVVSTETAEPEPAAVISDIQPAQNLNDPLAQSFPELLEVNEIQLNLDLAQQYIELGAYDSARKLLAEQQASYSTEQRQQADLLLNRIAS